MLKKFPLISGPHGTVFAKYTYAFSYFDQDYRPLAESLGYELPPGVSWSSVLKPPRPWWIDLEGGPKRRFRSVPVLKLQFAITE